MIKYIYNGVTYNSRKELAIGSGLTPCKIKAKLRDKEIILINTEQPPYDNYKTTL